MIIGKSDNRTFCFGIRGPRRPERLKNKAVGPGGHVAKMFVKQFFGKNALLRRLKRFFLGKLVFKPAYHPVSAENQYFGIVFVLINRRICGKKRRRLDVFIGSYLYTCRRTHRNCGYVRSFASHRKRLARFVRSRCDNGQSFGKSRNRGNLLRYIPHYFARLFQVPHQHVGFDTSENEIG